MFSDQFKVDVQEVGYGHLVLTRLGLEQGAHGLANLARKATPIASETSPLAAFQVRESATESDLSRPLGQVSLASCHRLSSQSVSSVSTRSPFVQAPQSSERRPVSAMK
jgi:hypothetical protein